MHVMEPPRPVTTIFIEWNADCQRAGSFVKWPLSRACAIGANVATVSPNNPASFASHALIVDPLIEHAQRKTLHDIDLCTLNVTSCTLIASLVVLQPRESTALETARQADHLRE